MPLVEGSILIDAPADELFALSQDYSLRKEWDPFVREMRFLDDAQYAAKGERVWVRAWTGLTMTVQFVSFHPPTSVAMKMIQGPWIFRRFAGTWLFKQREDGKTEVTFRYAFTTRLRLFRYLTEPAICWVFQRDVRARLRGLKRGAEELCLFGQLGEPCS